MFSFDTPPVNRSRSFLTLFFVFSSVSWPLFLRFHELSLSISLLSRASAREVRPGLPFLLFFWPPRRHWSDPRAQNSIKTNTFLTIQKSLRGSLERLRAAPRGSLGGTFGLGARLRGALGTPEIPDCTPLGRPGPLRGPPRGPSNIGLWRSRAGPS